MKKSILVVVVTLIVAASGLLMMATGQAAKPNAKVNLSGDEPFVLNPAVNAATPFTFTVPSTTSTGKAVKVVSIEFVTADCAAVTGTTFIGVAKISAPFQGTFGFYSLPFGPPMSFPNEIEFGSAHQTLIFADPGTTVSYGLSGGQPACTVTITGHLIT